MKIGVLGSGVVGQTLASGLIAHGHQVTIGTREPAKLKDWSEAHPKAVVAEVADTAKAGELIVLAVKGTAALAALKDAGEENLSGKVVMDATNPIANQPPESGVLKYFTSLDDSLLERLQRKYPNAKFVKAFNSVGSALMVNPKVPGGKPTMFICGNDESAKKAVGELVDQLGWETADMGTAEAARAIEPLAMLWCIPGFLHNQWTHAFKLIQQS
ncbi:MAG: DNA-binding protein [Candidatus Eisenbacteria bacterium]|nr:DNA-binding protein [Candidatus Latescibacterota bacterium]MBD3302620.1 DNA-binding protein [Candidatus Eisenbacteria bacterium]